MVTKKDLLFENLPTGKPHISFSELSDWAACSFRHKLKFVDKINLGDEKSVHMEFGTAIHASLDNFLKTRNLKKDIALDYIKAAWKENNFPDLEVWIAQAKSILADVHSWMDQQFGNDWEFIDAEHLLYEPINDHPHAFKGYIDGIILAKNAKGKQHIWLIDWKTSTWGWKREKKSDSAIQRQLIFYKIFWAEKTGTPMKDIKCGFVLLKRTAKPGKHCELVPVSVGPVTQNRSLKVINNMLISVKRGIALKNRHSCMWCDYYNTPYCV